MSDIAGGSVLRTQGLRKQYGTGQGLVRAVDEVDLEVAAGETVAVMGPSGCGKSTLLHLLGGLDRPSAGEVWLAGGRIDDLGEKALARIAPRPILFIHGDADTRIPVAHGYRLKAASRNPVDELWVVPGADHVQAFSVQPDAYAAKVLQFFHRNLT